MFFNFLAVVQGPRLSGRLREVSAMNLVYVSSNSEAMGPSYDHFYEILCFYMFMFTFFRGKYVVESR